MSENVALSDALNQLRLINAHLVIIQGVLIIGLFFSGWMLFHIYAYLRKRDQQ